jgi:hypothetical protein
MKNNDQIYTDVCVTEIVAALRHTIQHLLPEADRCRQKAAQYEHDGRPMMATPWHNKATAFSIAVKAMEIMLRNSTSSALHPIPNKTSPSVGATE